MRREYPAAREQFRNVIATVEDKRPHEPEKGLSSGAIQLHNLIIQNSRHTGFVASLPVAVETQSELPARMERVTGSPCMAVRKHCPVPNHR